ncbi:hypothetical protein L21SP3_02252 [Sedimentisphaera cyanobacteriorum]|uniref:DUF6677 domain-containing protein n=1 Tax=Sedimentisphaera cyanobacteriorum TaxID=1940790 RepID=A0A1Q2HSS4_9BACT|nr:DUF6677 family protein [Sedimentisphaera cyanobacteriorum]AQQ10420.1 hypothetical protein L21SP3_02252 [Sedimentisphaera cyanobacteriorum]
MAQKNSTLADRIMFAASVALVGWVVPGGGYFLVRQKKKAAAIFISLTLLFAAGLYIGSIGVIDRVNSIWWYYPQMIFSPVVAFIGNITASGEYPVYGKPAEIGQLYTGLAGLLNLICIFKASAVALHGDGAFNKPEKQNKDAGKGEK